MEEKNNSLNRRAFLTSSISCAMAAGIMGFAPNIADAQESPKESSGKGKIIYRKLGKTGMSVPIISMGVGAASNPNIINAAYEKGVRHFDTAANYQYGINEQMVGNVISRLGVRDKITIATKILIPQQRAALAGRNAYDKINSVLAASLKRLKTDYVDILYVHDVSNAEEVSNQEILGAFKKFKEQGKAKAIGITTHGNMAAVINVMNRIGEYDAVLTAINFTMAENAELMNAIETAGSKGMAIVAMKTLAGGYNWPNPESRRNYDNATVLKAALKWVLNNPNISTAIPGFSNFDHLDMDFSIAYDLSYTPDEKKLLGDNNIKLSLGFCQQCRRCLASCPNGAEIPTLMRVYMYTAQYADFPLARQTMDEIPRENGLSACKSCSECTARCANSVNIPERIRNLKLVYA